MSWAQHTTALLALKVRALSAAIELAEEAPSNSEQQAAAAARVLSEAYQVAALARCLKVHFVSLSGPE